MSARPMKPIPVSAAKRIATIYGYDQVIIIARRVGEATEPNGEHVTTYGRTAEHCGVAARVGDFLKYKIMGWTPPAPKPRKNNTGGPAPSKFTGTRGIEIEGVTVKPPAPEQPK